MMSGKVRGALTGIRATDVSFHNFCEVKELVIFRKIKSKFI